MSVFSFINYKPILKKLLDTSKRGFFSSKGQEKKIKIFGIKNKQISTLDWVQLDKREVRRKQIRPGVNAIKEIWSYKD